MARVGHGGGILNGATTDETAESSLLSVDNPAPAFGYMFSVSPSERPADQDRLPESPDIMAQLDALGEAMGSGDADEPSPGSDLVMPGDNSVPAGYTYLGQFIDHDITFTAGAPDVTAQLIEPLPSLASLSNQRTPLLELDSVYGPSPGQDSNVPVAQGGRMVVGVVTDIGGLPPGKSLLNDVPRKPRSATPEIDREARIGDPRNDENLIVQQLHVAFLKAHNTLAEQLGSFDAARTALILMYQSVVVDDFLPRICDRSALDAILQNGNRFLKPDGPAFMPVEFAAAGFRFGHSMVRNKYNFNLNFLDFSSSFMFTFTALSGQLSPGGGPGTDTFPTNWVVEWQHFIELPGTAPQRARPIDPVLTPILANLRDVFGVELAGNIAPRLAKRNLRRGYSLALPTGQAVAARIGTPPIGITSASTGLGDEAIAPFIERTPLWLYVLAEAKQNGGKLGVVGTTIVAETLIALIKRSKPSIFDSKGRRISANRHVLADIVRLAAVQDR
jgi:hypothetical protein